MDEERRKLSDAWKRERNELMARRKAFYEKLQGDCPRLWRKPTEKGWLPQPSTPETWDNLIYTLSVQIEELLDSIQEMFPVEEMPYVQQCKEKFGGLRFYISHYPPPIQDELEKLIVGAEAASMNICSKCTTMKTTKVRTHFPPPFEEHRFGHICPYCDDCFEEEVLRRAKGSGVKAMRKWYYETMAARKAARKKNGDK